MKKRNINKIILHCSATKQGRDIKTATIKNWHVKGRGWSDIGYHFCIELNGDIVEGRPIEKAGAHTYGENKNSIGVCYVGGLDSNKNACDTRTKAQKESMDKLIKSLLEQYPKSTVHGHYEFSNKSCPCFDVQKEYGKPASKKSISKSIADE